MEIISQLDISLGHANMYHMRLCYLITRVFFTQLHSQLCLAAARQLMNNFQLTIYSNSNMVVIIIKKKHKTTVENFFHFFLSPQFFQFPSHFLFRASARLYFDVKLAILEIEEEVRYRLRILIAALSIEIFLHKEQSNNK
jgi:hypothetical protein